MLPIWTPLPYCIALQGNDALVNEIVKACMSMMQGDFGLSLTQDGYLPAAFLVRCLTHGPILPLP